MTEIKGRVEVDLLVKSFYEKATDDEVIGHFFTDVIKINWNHHIPLIADFWETTLFHKAVYKGNPITPHIALHKKSPMSKSHFDRWVALWCETVDELFEGDKAIMAKQRAQSIATVMFLKVSQ